MTVKKIRLTAEDVQTKQENALDLFYSGIKSKETLRTMERNLKSFLLDACADLFSGDLNERAQEFVNWAKNDQDKTTQIILAYVRKLKERTKFSKSDPDYLNPSTIPNKIKPIRKLLEMNNLGLGWKRIHTTYPEHDNTLPGRGYTLEEIQKMLEHSDSIATDFIILASCSGGLRVGAWDNLTWDCIFPIYQVGSEYTLDKNDHGIVVCTAMKVYKGTPDEYYALISIEAWKKLEQYRTYWTNKMSRPPIDSDPLILERFANPMPLTSKAVRKRIEKLLIKSEIRTPLTEGNRRYPVPATHGFRRFWDKVMMTSQKKRGTLSALAIKERLMGHDGVVATDKNYFWTDVLDFVSDYLDAMPGLIINQETRLAQQLANEKAKSSHLEAINQEKETALQRIDELESLVHRLTGYALAPP